MTDAEISIPIEIHESGLVLVDVVDDVPATFILDTAASHTVVSPGLVERLGLATERLPGYTGNIKTAPRMTGIRDLRVGSARYADFSVAVTNLGPVEVVLRRRVDGLIGGNILMKRRYSLDLPGSMLILNPAPDPDAGIPFEESNNRILLPTRIDDERIFFLLDTGANLTRMESAAFDRFALGDGSTSREVVNADINEMQVTSFDASSIPELWIGENRMVDVPVYRGDENLLGMDALGPCGLTVDPFRKLVFLRCASSRGRSVR